MRAAIYRSKNWPKLSTSILVRDGFTCHHCGIQGTRKTLDCHHIVPFRLFKNMRDANAKSNLITLCKRCHAKADNAYWAAHPEQFSSKRLPYPSCPPRSCEKCGDIMSDPSSATKFCRKCRTFRCDVCHKTFMRPIKDRNRVERFCSRACNVAFRKEGATWTKRCADCGKKIIAGRRYCRRCWLKDPAGRVRPGHKPGRKLKDRPAVPTIPR
jgi:hypothetical protein